MDSDDENLEEQQWGGSEASVLLVDVSPPMWETVSDEKPISIVFSVCTTLIRQMMISSPNQLIGIALFGTKQNDQGINNTIQLIPLKEPAVDDIMKLQDLESNLDRINIKWGITDDFTYAYALWQAKRMFSNCKKKLDNKTITVLSRLTEPNRNTHRDTLKGASEVDALGITVNIVHVSDEQIPRDSFFFELGKVIHPNSEWDIPLPVMAVDDILPLIWQVSHGKRATSKVHLYLGADVKLGVGVYSLCRPKPPPKKINLNRETNDLVESSSIQKVDGEEQTRSILRSEMSIYTHYGGKNIEFTNAEIIQLKKFAGEPYMRLLGFKPSSVLDKSKWYLKPCAFLYPDENSIKGSTQLFLCLRDRCDALDRIALCVMVPRWYCHPRLVALVPQKRIMKDGKQIQPDGFHIIYLPYADNIKNIVMEGQAEVSEEQMQCVEKIIGKLKFLYTGGMFENPKLQTLHNAIEALALNEENPREVFDTTNPDLEQQTSRLKDFPIAFNTLFGEMELIPSKKPTDGSNKRKAEEVDAPDLALLSARVREGNVDKYTVAQLKQILKWRNISNLPAMTGIKKNQLIQLVTTHCEDI